MFLLILQALLFFGEASNTNDYSKNTETIYVRILSGLDHVSIQGKNLKLAGYPLEDNKIQIHFNDHWLITNDKKALFKSKDKKVLKIQSEKARVFHRLVEGEMHLHWNEKKNSIDVILPVPIEEYLKGVIPSEMPAFWPIEALKAQVVASKSYVLSQIKEKKGFHFDVDASIMDQVYNSDKFEKLSPKLKTKVKKAILETKNLYLTNQEEVLKAYFHSHCGGHTENPKKVWHSKEKWQGVVDPYCNRLKTYSWDYDLDLNDFAKKISKYFKEEPSDVTKILEGERNASGRLDKLYVFFEDGRIRSLSTQNLRKTLGFGKVKSTQMKVSLFNGRVRFKGEGFGHGVGMCQHGAKKMARLGKSHQEILAFYYPAAKLTKRAESSKFLAATK